jgi:hypothetical protein
MQSCSEKWIAMMALLQGNVKCRTVLQPQHGENPEQQIWIMMKIAVIQIRVTYRNPGLSKVREARCG